MPSGWFVLEAVEAMELDAFYAAYRADGRSRPALDPAMMVTLILYAYARGTRSSRAIERACIENIAFRVIAAQRKLRSQCVADQGSVGHHQHAAPPVCARRSAIGRRLTQCQTMPRIDGRNLPRSALPQPPQPAARSRPPDRQATARDRRRENHGTANDDVEGVSF